MLKYSSYQSIYNTAVVQGGHTDGRAAVQNKSSLVSMLRLFVAVIVLWISFAGLFTVFAGSSDLHASDEKVVVLSGDTLWGIAQEHKPDYMDTRVYIEGIIRINGLESSGIRAGDVLLLPEF
ncbi:LysM peptidoglycan-binding domain-containing protein [Paenibacillus jiagnxiensis]|uniref:LysM peptidoglycan-binding domain-containing protein n=1 Tax=Paenibacillus jiagnxiensis TaxID=3228926 RepID=UPI0033B681E4